MQQAIMIVPSRPASPAVSRRPFGLGTIASPCGDPAYRKSAAGRTYCEREAELERQAEAWAEVYRKLGIKPPSVRPSDAELGVLARAASEMGDDLPVRNSPPLQPLTPAVFSEIQNRSPLETTIRVLPALFTLSFTRRLIKDGPDDIGLGQLYAAMELAVVGGSLYLIRRLARKS